VSDGALADAFDCTECHVKPDSLFQAGHLGADSIAEITWGGIAPAPGIMWNRAGANCSGTYCHGNFAGGKALNAPSWNSGFVACGSCHDVGTTPADLGWKHEYHVNAAGLKCADCHAGVVDTTDNITAIDLHVNGVADTLTRDTTLCSNCHGGGATACTFCHGGGDNASGAPPDGLRGETARSDLAVGAHTVHVSGGNRSVGYDCTECHVKPFDLSDPGHLGIDSIAEITWGGIAPASGINWNRGTAQCSNNYCHGNFPGGYPSNTSVWTNTNQAACGSCHDVGSNPSDLSGEHDRHVRDKNVECYECHARTVDQAGAIADRNVHVNGIIEVVFVSGQGIWDGADCTGVGCHGRETWR
jgi:predicted CxxxxCH...CXXCH cytochrome family protein